MGEVPWVDCNDGRRNRAVDPCPHCGSGKELEYVEVPTPEPLTGCYSCGQVGAWGIDPCPNCGKE